MPITITRLTNFSSEAADEIRNLAQQEGKNYKELRDDDLKDMLQSQNTHLLVARNREGKIVGMITVLVFRIPYVKKSSIEDLVVDENSRGQGIGSSLMEEAVNVARESGAHYVDFTSRPRRDESNSLYEKLGFKQRETNVYRYIFDYGEV
jgi:ribosomal protein S18 acetylase RimI-like enzyme